MDHQSGRASAVTHARTLWTELAGVPAGFTTPSSVVVAPGSLLCPPGWAGIVRIGDAALATAPDARTAEALGRAVGKLSYAELVDPVRLGEALSGGTAPVLDVLGPAALFYGGQGRGRDAFVPAFPGAAGVTVERAASDAPALTALLAAAGTADADESGLDEITSPAFLLRRRTHGDVVAAAGYLTWPRSVAHMCVLVSPHHRGRGLARIVASAAVSHALVAGLLPQWRARPYASRRVAVGLGLQELGAQLSVRM
ncbi:GNAT family N-acetyltransferase [Streptomyces sp. NPDC050433]|uniref:GNAT family N-acetyltransferase n=1 Tax=unclassified Streptomyces TaxID=2593676 RepID=UPI003436208C